MKEKAACMCILSLEDSDEDLRSLLGSTTFYTFLTSKRTMF
jgi:hypothetical protein